jgi:alkylhydroperoxidase family enzyme
MAWIQIIDEPEPGSDLHRIYEEQRRQAGAVANILKIHSLAPNALAAHLELYKAAMHSTGELNQRDRELIAVAVSRANNCEY